MFLISDLNLTESLANLGKNNFESILREELRREYARLPLERFNRQGGVPDRDSMEIRIERVDSERIPDRVYITVHVLFDAIGPVKNTEVTRIHCEGRFTVVLNPGSDGRKLPKAYHEFDTQEIYPEVHEPPPMPSEQEESEWFDLLSGCLRKLEAATPDIQHANDVRKIIGIVQRQSGQPHSERMRSFLADSRRRLDLLLYPKGDDG